MWRQNKAGESPEWPDNDACWVLHSACVVQSSKLFVGAGGFVNVRLCATWWWLGALFFYVLGGYSSTSVTCPLLHSSGQWECRYCLMGSSLLFKASIWLRIKLTLPVNLQILHPAWCLAQNSILQLCSCGVPTGGAPQSAFRWLYHCFLNANTLWRDRTEAQVRAEWWWTPVTGVQMNYVK